MPDDAELLQQLATRVLALPEGRRFVAVDGVDGSGKTVFAARLATAVRACGREVIEVHVDDFHHLRARRYALGRTSPEGFWLDSYDYDALERDVLSPLGPGGSARYRWGATDLDRDVRLELDPVDAPEDAIVLIEGIFLHRDELAHRWDLSVWLDVPFDETARRMAVRDGVTDDPDGVRARRYIDGQRLYFAACRPWERATIVVDNRDWTEPRVVDATRPAGEQAGRRPARAVAVPRPGSTR